MAANRGKSHFASLMLVFVLAFPVLVFEMLAPAIHQWADQHIFKASTHQIYSMEQETATTEEKTTSSSSFVEVYNQSIKAAIASTNVISSLSEKNWRCCIDPYTVNSIRNHP